MNDWFRHGGFWHKLESGKRSFCGTEPLDQPQIVHAEPNDLPPNPCRACLMVWLRDEVDEEPLEDAIGRGYVEADLESAES